MRLLVLCACLILAIAFVYSKPIISQMNKFNAIITTSSSLQILNDQFNNIAGQIIDVLSPIELQILQQKAVQLAVNVYNGKVDSITAADQLLQHLEEYLGSNLQVFSTVKPLVQQLTEAVILVVPILPSNTGKHEVSGVHTSLNDLLVLLDQLQLHTWNAVIAVFPKYSDLVNQLVDAIDQITNAFSSPQLNSLAQQIIYLALDVYDEKVGIYVAADQLFLQVKQYLGSNAKLFSNIQFFAQQLIDAIILVVPILPSNNEKRETSAAHVNGFAVITKDLLREMMTRNHRRIVNVVSSGILSRNAFSSLYSSSTASLFTEAGVPIPEEGVPIRLYHLGKIFIKLSNKIQQNKLQGPYLLKSEIHTYNPNAPKHEQKRLAHK
ncbi:unnamed protein product [Adineta steineri]|uniref:Uncharacterized protein n=2 Tax=Adineta steineri TaxID=433720 RepID=A0A814QKD3_9BILA|nr:unnamed protein product [Adineta steineri]